MQILIYYVTIARPHLKKVTPSFPATPSKSWGPIKPPFLKFGWRLNPSPPPAERGGGGAHYVTLTDTDKLRLESEISLLLTAHPELLNSRIALYFSSDLNHSLKFDWQTGRKERQADQKTNMLVVVTHLNHLIYNIN